MIGEGDKVLSNGSSNAAAVAATCDAIISNETPVSHNEAPENVSPSEMDMAVDDEVALSHQVIPVGGHTDNPPEVLLGTPPAGASLPPSPAVTFDEEDRADQSCSLIGCEKKPPDDMQVIHPPCLKDKIGAWE
jgi:hypothetical protein